MLPAAGNAGRLDTRLFRITADHDSRKLLTSSKCRSIVAQLRSRTDPTAARSVKSSLISQATKPFVGSR